MKIGKHHISSGLLIGLALVLFFVISLLLRVLPSQDVIKGDAVKFASNDAYYYMHLVDNQVHNFPRLTSFDPFSIYPGGSRVGGTLFFVWFQAFIIWIIGLGSPSQHLVDVMGALFPPIMAALTVIPVYFIGKTLFNRWAGLLAAGLFAVLPGEFLGRTIIGSNDTPWGEVFFSTVTLAFLVLAITTASQRELTFNHLIKRDWKVFIKPLVFSLLAGVFLGLYLNTWFGALLFVFIISLYLIFQFILNHLRGKSSEYLGIVSVAFFLVALIVFLPFSPAPELSFALVFAPIIPLVLVIGSWLMFKQGLKRIYYPLALVVLAVGLIVIVKAVYPNMFQSLWGWFSFVFFPGGSTATTTQEMQPFLSPQGTFSTAIAWGNFTTSFFLFPKVAVPGFAIISFFILFCFYSRQNNETKPQWIARVGTMVVLLAVALLLIYFSLIWALIFFVLYLVILMWFTIKQNNNEKPPMLFFFWTVVMVAATLVQRRFAYYFVVNVALLSGYISWGIISFFNSRKEEIKPEESVPSTYKQARNIGIIAGIIIIIALIIIHTPMYIFIPVWICGIASILYGSWAWAKIKGHKDLWALWGLLVPIGFLILAFSKEKTKKAKAKNEKKEQLALPVYALNVTVLIIMVFSIIFWTNINKSKEVAAGAPYAPSDAWQASLTWMKDNTPEPLGTDTYYQLYVAPSPGEQFKYPDTVYAVTSWWDYGYWISRIAHRIPNNNPSQAGAPIQKTAELFLSTDKSRIQEIVKEFKSDYIVADYSMLTSKFWAIVDWAGRQQSDFFETYFYIQGKQATPVQVINTAYYNCLLTRLFNFDGKAVTNVTPAVITYVEKTDNSGQPYKQITDVQQFDSYQEAVDYVNKQGPSTHKIVGTNPFTTPIPLEAVTDYQLVYSSDVRVQYSENGTVPEVKIFEYTRK